jgi:hypothetical protein
MLALTALEKRNNSELERVRFEERKRAEIDLNKLRDSFIQREKETVDDLHCLEKLHKEQYARLVSTHIN